ncbi:FtsX-like permease family protein [uncultured Anaerofustis sp.]|uniref:FtsX-like permease family protein n=1 Tax=uncultured Anaerofustis sp. TaxID=904996 RepID=UPI0025ED9410|nr:FtsX-like permease family protein [uncultured Anaerofustis sp.]
MKTLLKDLFREIKTTKNRFISILLITLLGVCFFVGLRVIGPQMEFTANKYFEDTNLYDINFMSTYGFNDKDVEAIKNDKNTKDILATYSTELLLKNGDDSIVAKAFGMPSDKDIKMMKYELIQGTYPKKNDECVISDNYMQFKGYKLGDILTIEDHDGVKLKVKKLKIVGSAEWSYYITDDDYGSSTLGNGSINTFLILNKDVFDSSVYTDLYVSLNNVDKVNCFSEEYKDIIDDYKTDIKKVTNERGKERLKEEKDKANKKIKKSESKLNNKKKETYDKLNKAKNTLDSNKIKLNNSENELRRTKKETKSKLKKAKNDLDKAKKELPSNEKKLKKAKEEIKKARSEFEQGKAQFEQYLAGLSEQEKEYLKDVISNKQKELDIAEAKVEKGEKQVKASEQELLSGKQKIKDGYKDLEKQEKKANLEFKKAEDQIKEGRAELNKGYASYEKNKIKADDEFKKAEDKIKKAKKKVEDLKEVKWYTLDRNSNESYFSYADNSKKITSLAKVFPLIFFLVAALVCLTTMTRMVEEKRTELGILKALGFSKWAVSIKFIVYAFLASFIGSVVGLFIGFTLVPKMIYNAYRILYKTPDLATVIYPSYILLSLFIGVMCTVLSAYFACNSDLKEVSASLLRPKVMKSGRKTLLEKIPAVWNKISFKWKITIRNLVRYKKRLIMSVVGIGACCGLLIAAFGIRYSVSAIVDLQYNTIWNYNMETSIESDLSNKEINDIKYTYDDNKEIKGSKLFFKDTYSVVGKNKDYSFSLMVPIDKDAVNDYIYLSDYETGDKINMPKSGVVITSRLSEIADIKKGDIIKIKDLDDKEYDVPVVNIINNYVYHYMFLSEDYYKTIVDEDIKPNLILSRLNKNDESTYDKLSETLLKDENISSIEFNERVAENFAGQLDSMDFVIVVIIVAAGMLAFVVMFNLDNINVSERIREIATIKVLGFYNNEVNFYIVRENIILNIIGIIVGCIVGKYFHRYLIDTVSVDFVQFYKGIQLSSYIFGIILTIVFAFIVNLFLKKTLKKINMVESLKSVE